MALERVRTAIDFDQGIVAGAKNVIYFYPDGSAADVLGNVNNGVVYIARPGFIDSSRAITLWGATGRLRGWRRLPRTRASITGGNSES